MGDEALRSALSDLTIDVVRNNASIGFMASLNFEDASAFWQHIFDRVVVGKVILLVAEDTETKAVIGTVQLLIDQPANQPHRADVAKMHVHSASRRLGIGEALLHAIEEEAKKRNKHILVLDTVMGSPASFLYQKLGWIKVGDIPEYALYPDGEFCSTTYFYKKLS